MRQGRWKVFSDLTAGLPRPVRVLDVGGAEPFWAAMGASGNRGLESGGGKEKEGWEFEVTMVNLHAQETRVPFVRAVTGSALDLSGFRRSDYDVVFSNSVIEHLGSWTNQQRMAREVLNTGLPFCIQTPNRYFPLEPHFLLPGFQFLPRATRIWLASRWRYGSYCRPGDRAAAAAAVDEIRLLTVAEMGTLFPGAKLHLERIGVLVKSVMAVGRGSPPRRAVKGGKEKD